MPSNINKNIKKYLECSKLLNQFFQKLGFCKKCPTNNSCGCCKTNVFGFYKNVDKKIVKRFKKIVYSKFRKANNPRMCYYLKKGKGCVLNEYKPPFCIAFICSDLKRYLRKEHNINYSFERTINKLRKTLNGDISKKEYKQFINELIANTKSVKQRA